VNTRSHEQESGSGSDPLAAWARSGLMALSGPPEGPPAIPAFDALAGIEALIGWVRAASPVSDNSLALDARLLTERAALMGLTRGGAASCNRSCRFIEARDGWIAVNLARESDVQSLPAWIGGDDSDEPWQAIAAAAPSFDKADLVEKGRLLGLAVAAVPLPGERASSLAAPWSMHAIGSGGGAPRDWRRHPPRVIDLSALWAGPLCGGLLATLGARVIKVESSGRPDSIRASCPAFFDLLNAGKQSVVIDFTAAADRARLAQLIVRSDVVISSVRPRAFEQLGLEPAALAEKNPALTWVALTAYGCFGPGRNFVGFGDDAAAAAGLMIWGEDGRPMFAGDAIADPLAGLAATAGALQSLQQGGGMLIDVSLREAAAFVARGPRLRPESCNVVCREGEWYVHSGGRSISVLPPRARTTTAHAAPFGADTQRVLTALLSE
jgi:hypothetical protein